METQKLYISVNLNLKFELLIGLRSPNKALVQIGQHEVPLYFRLF